jgi:MipA family protein
MVLALLVSAFPVTAEPYQNERDETPQKEAAQARKQQTGWFYGAFVSTQSNLYKGANNDSLALPFIGYKGPRFSLIGPQASYRLNKDEDFQTFAQLAFNSAGFKEKDSAHLIGMSTRSGSLFGGLNVTIKQQKLSYKFSYLHDLQNRSGGQDIRLSTSYFYNIGPFFITPNIALNYWDSAYTDYYFGVRSNESNGNRNPYKPSAAINPSIGLNLATPIFFQGFTRANFSHHWLGGPVKSSPILDTSRYWNMNISFTRFF